MTPEDGRLGHLAAPSGPRHLDPFEDDWTAFERDDRDGKVFKKRGGRTVALEVSAIRRE